jgi:hypothetical protein
MRGASNGASDIRPGQNDPSGVRRILILGYYDGATEGVLELGPLGDVYQFRLVGELCNPDGIDRRTFVLEPLPPDALERLACVIGAYIDPNWPAWVPIWRFPDEPTRLGVEAEVDVILAAAGSPAWQIETDDHITFKRFTATPLVGESVPQG